MPTTKRYRVLVSWVHRKWGPQQERLAAEGSSIRPAFNSALFRFLHAPNSRQRRADAHAHVDVKIWRLKREK